MIKTASVSACGKYRYVLFRKWGDGPNVSFIMLNPSTADDKTDDPTVTRCIKRAQSMGFGSLNIVNLFALRATDPAELRRVADPIGDVNMSAIAAAVVRSNMIICAWGKHGAYKMRGDVVRTVLKGMGVPLHHLGLNKDDTPKHPLYVPYSQQPILWED